MTLRSLSALCIPLALVACGSGADPQLAMCQAVAKQLTGNSVASWERVEQADSARSRRVRIDYGTASGGSGSIECAFPIDGSGTVATGPNRVVLDGTPVEQKVLLRAGINASKELIAGTAAETVKRTRELAGEASEKAREVAGQALDSAIEAGQTLQDTLDQ